MKHADLKLDTVYADQQGRPLLVVSLDKVDKPSRGYGSRAIRDHGQFSGSFGVVIIRTSFASRSHDLDALTEAAATLRGARPEKEGSVGEFPVLVESTRNIVEEWDDHLVRLHAETEREQAAATQRARAQQVRADHINRITALLPDNMEARNMHDGSDFAQLRLDHLLALLEAARAVAGSPEDAPTSPFSGRDLALLAAGFDEAVKSLTYQDGTPVEVAEVTNPYRKQAQA